MELLSGHQQEEGGRTGKLLVEMCETGHRWCNNAADFSAAMQRIFPQDQMTRLTAKLVQVIGSTEDDHWGRSSRENLMAQLTLSDISNSQVASLSSAVINRKGSHVKKMPFQLQPLDLQWRTHIYIHTYIQKHTHTLSHTNTWAWSESKGWFQRQLEWRIKQDRWHRHCGIVPSKTALTCIHVTAKHRLFG